MIEPDPDSGTISLSYNTHSGEIECWLLVADVQYITGKKYLLGYYWTINAGLGR